MTDDMVQFSAQIDRRFAAGAPTQTPVVRVRDVIVCAADNNVDIDVDEYREHLPVGESRIADDEVSVESVELGRGVILTMLDDDEAELIVNACTQRGHYFHPVRQFGQRYSLVRERPLAEWEDRPYRWDADHTLGDTLMLARLIRDNGFSMQYAARIVDYEDGQKCVVYLPGNEGKAAYRVRRDREWLDGPEAEELAALLDAFWQADLPERVQRAAWRVEYASWQRYSDVMLPMIVGGLEALLKIGRCNLTAQFKRRVTPLAHELGIEDIDEDFCERMYDARSDWVHGSHVQLFGPDGDEDPDPDRREALAEIGRLQETLKRTVRKTIEDPEFRAIFEDDERIAERWPA